MSTFVIYPLTCVKNVSMLSSVSLLGILFLSMGVLAILFFGITNLDVSSSSGYDAVVFPWWPEDLSGFFSFIGVSCFCYAVCTLVFPIEDSLRDKESVHTAVFWALSFCWAVYAVLSGTGILYLFGTSAVQSNILLNLPANSTIGVVVRLSMAMVNSGIRLLYPIVFLYDN
jgi:hypothetical protein